MPDSPEPIEPPHVVLLLHGIRTRAEWTGPLSELLRENGLTPQPIGYGYFDLVRFLVPGRWLKQSAINKLRNGYSAVLDNFRGAKISLVAHSFGSYLVATQLLEDRSFRLHRLVLAGGIIPEDFPWHLAVSRIGMSGQTGTYVVNDCGRRDIWPVMAKLVSSDYGASGRFGFGSVDVADRTHGGFGHSDVLSTSFAAKFWVPFLRDGTICAAEPPTEKSSWFVNLLSIVPFRAGVVIAALIGIVWLTVDWVNHDWSSRVGELEARKFELAHSFDDRGQSAAAESAFVAATEFARLSGNSIGEVAGTLGIGKTLEQQGHVQQALIHYRLAREKAASGQLPTFNAVAYALEKRLAYRRGLTLRAPSTSAHLSASSYARQLHDYVESMWPDLAGTEVPMVPAPNAVEPGPTDMLSALLSHVTRVLRLRRIALLYDRSEFKDARVEIALVLNETSASRHPDHHAEALYWKTRFALDQGATLRDDDSGAASPSSKDALDTAERGFLNARRADGLARIALTRAIHHFYSGDTAETQLQLGRLDALLALHPDEPLNASFRLYRGIVMWTSYAKFGIASEDLRDAQRTFDLIGDNEGAAYASVELAKLHLTAWDFRGAERELRRADDRTGLRDYVRASIAFTRARIRLAEGDDSGARKHLREVEDLLPLDENVDAWNEVETLRGDIAVSEQRRADAGSHYEIAFDRNARGRGADLTAMLALRIALVLRDETPSVAAHYLDIAREALDSSAFPVSKASSFIVEFCITPEEQEERREMLFSAAQRMYEEFRLPRVQRVLYEAREKQDFARLCADIHRWLH